MKCPVQFTRDCPLKQTAAILGFDNSGINERRSHGADDEITERDFEGDGEEDQLDEAAEIAGVTDRTMRRIRDRYEEFGYTGLFDQRLGKRSTHRIPMETAEEVLRLYREVYFDFNIRHFHEKLQA